MRKDHECYSESLTSGSCWLNISSEMTRTWIFCLFVCLDFARLSSAKRCVSLREFERRAARYIISAHSFQVSTHRSHLQQQWAKQSCARFIQHTESQASAHYNHRSLSPWGYRIDEREDRFPGRIMVAECLCKGCIVNGHEDLTYNSVPVRATFKVLRKTVCPGNPDQYQVTVDSVTIPVACTCVTPRQRVE
ncbi:hypothetical protein DPEC_G00249670 [Dallia pectoralis]|uniref:Uncharacterized protein n=1 Tax=Dallia pectoralis TaxID=75939 RepID=A0ACC2FSP6_DALPE|nr:hypothetical protein DPEC_G00249670 [Dallia pectoralis]